MSSPVTVLGTTVLWPTTGDTGYSAATLQLQNLLATAVAPISGLYNTTTGLVGNLGYSNANELTLNGVPIAVGSVTSVGLTSSNLTVTGSPITTSGTLTVALPNTAVTPGSYTYTNLTVDAFGRITAASNGTTPVTGPAGSNTQIQFNNSGVFGASSALTWNGTELAVSGNFRFSGNSRVLSGVMSSSSPNNNLAIQSSTSNDQTRLDIIPNGTSTSSAIRLFDNSDRTNASLLYAGVSSVPGFNFIGSDVTGTGTLRGLILGAGTNVRVVITTAGNLGLGASAPVTSATDGFPYISACAGTPTGVPTTVTGRAALVVDSTNNKLYFYSGGAWQDSTSGTGTVTSVDVSSTNGTITFSGNPITTSGTIDLDVDESALDLANIGGSLDLSTQVTGTLAIADGGTGQTTANDALNALLPVQTGNAGEFLTTDGTNTSWASVVSSPAGANTEIQFNNSGAFGASSSLTWDGTTQTLGGNLTFSGTGRKIRGDLSNATVANRLMIQNSVTNGNSLLSVIPNGTAQIATVTVENSSTPGNNSLGYIGVNSTAVQIASGLRGSGTLLPMNFIMGATTALTVDTSSNTTVQRDLTVSGGSLFVERNSSTVGGEIIVNNSDNSTCVDIQGGDSTDVDSNGGRIRLQNKDDTYPAVTISATTYWDPMDSGVCGGMIEGFTPDGKPSWALYSGDGNPASNAGNGELVLWEKSGTIQSTRIINNIFELHGFDATVPTAPVFNLADVRAAGGTTTNGASLTLSGLSDAGQINGRLALRGSNDPTGDTAVSIFAESDQGSRVDLLLSGVNSGIVQANGDLNASGNISAANLSGTNTGDQTVGYEIQTATAAQTIFSTTVPTVANGSGKAYLQVFVNGVKQVEGGGYAYTVTGANEITFNTGLVGGEAVEFYAFT